MVVATARIGNPILPMTSEHSVVVTVVTSVVTDKFRGVFQGIRQKGKNQKSP